MTFKVNEKINWIELRNEATGTIIKISKHTVWVKWNDNIPTDSIGMRVFLKYARHQLAT